jgi:hypothetical protein
VRFVLRVDLELLDDDVSVAVRGIAELHEAESCRFSDVDDAGDVDLTLAEDESRTLDIDLENDGFDGGDTARFDIEVVNARAP